MQAVAVAFVGSLTCKALFTRAWPSAEASHCPWSTGRRPVVVQPPSSFHRSPRPTPASHRCRLQRAPGRLLRMAQQQTPPPPPFELRGFSLAKVLTAAGAALTGWSFVTYFQSSGTASATSLTFIYGLPILLLGLALWYAELKPVPLETTAEAQALRDRRATSVQKQIIRDVTRHRYGDEAHLSAALRALRVIAKGEPAPTLVKLEEAATSPDGEYALTLLFESPLTPLSAFQKVEGRMDTFFGGGIRHELRMRDAEKQLVELKLITVSEGEGGSGSAGAAATSTTTSSPSTPSASTPVAPSKAITPSHASADPRHSRTPFALFRFKPTRLPGPPQPYDPNKFV
ncbi:hypothetical protein CDCA_CDCA10G2991 [Cyanidium caldarium]|uniref:Thylakoid membrane protein n=1 Tax=Cyanidium caldarium TaxID=2771 RepID=A0AAV9IY02_CYACA|nr:hypothetical protein CDCA_CDCA10G2991 [Cyanidium caldarium]